MKFKCAFCGSIQDEDPGACCGEMREDMCDYCEEAMSCCTCDAEEEDSSEDEDDQY